MSIISNTFGCIVSSSLILLVIAGIFAVISCRAMASTELPMQGGWKKIHSIGDRIQQNQGGVVHIIYVHGMNQREPGASGSLRERLCEQISEHLEMTCTFESTESEKLSVGPYPGEINAFGTPIWSSETEWDASQPYVDRYVFFLRGNGASKIILDEVNWWPFVFPIKCRALVLPEADLAGPDEKTLKLCAKSTDLYHQWIDENTLSKALQKPSKGAFANRKLKQNMIDWGFSDAVIALGPLQEYFHTAMEKAFEFSQTGKKEGANTERHHFVIITESLGSFLMFDAMMRNDTKTTAVDEVVMDTSDLYFFANQVALLNLGRLETPTLTRAPGRPSLAEILREWANPGRGERQTEALTVSKQIVAFSDPSDLLTYDMPKLDYAEVVNIHVRNACDFFGIVSNPVTAHTGHSQNTKEVLRRLFKPNQVNDQK